jgi:YfhG lipoprotein
MTAHATPRTRPLRSAGRLATLLAGSMLSTICGCTTPQAPQAAAPAIVVPETMNGLGESDPVRQADIFYEVERDYTKAPTTTNTLRYAGALITAGHSAARPAEGKKLLEELLARPERLNSDERTLAAVLLHETNERLKLAAENRRLLETLDDRSRTQANSEKRVQAQVEENARLRRELAAARQKLDAVKEIERTIIERTPSPSGNRDLNPTVNPSVNPSEAQSPPAGS